MIIYKCDICAETILNPNDAQYINFLNSTKTMNQTFDSCPKCVSLIRDLITEKRKENNIFSF